MFDGNSIRKVDGSEEGEVNCLSITREGEHLVTGGEDKVVKLWDYDTGKQHFQGVGHTSPITNVMVAPDQLTVVSTGSEGAIFIWRTPEAVLLTKADKDLMEGKE